jgi:hypothetical protein
MPWDPRQSRRFTKPKSSSGHYELVRVCARQLILVVYPRLSVAKKFLE